jgi:outer membrane biosynthesis protein TonB
MSSLRVLNRIAKDKSLRLWFVGFFLFFMVWQPTPAYAQMAYASITCLDSAGATITRQVGWDNENNYFLDKGNIPQHYCEGGYAGQFTTFVGVVSSDGSELDPALLYHPGYLAPDPVAPTPSPEPVPETQTTVRTDDVERTDEVATADVARTEEVVREPEPVAPVAPIAPEPEPTPEPTPTPTPEPEPSPTSPVRPVEPTKPPEVITPTPEPVVPSTSPTEPTIPSEPTPEPKLPEETISIELALEAVGKLVDNLRSIGSDMTPEVREQAQQVVVASVIVTQVALAGRKP